MKNLKMKLLTLGILVFTVVMSSATAFASTNTSNGNDTNKKSVVTKTTLQSASNEYATNIFFSTTRPGWVRIISSVNGWYAEIEPTAIMNYVGYNRDNIPSNVKALQLALNHYGYNLSVDSQFGPSTHGALVAFQKRYNLSADGTCGPNTWRAFVTHF
jgi:peptidoglycan hydrolase-like protein with peptidoglycan-binding domain